MRRAWLGLFLLLVLVLAVFWPLSTDALSVDQSFRGTTATGWTLGGNAVLTASSTGGAIDPAGSGFLRLTSATGGEAGL